MKSTILTVAIAMFSMTAFAEGTTATAPATAPAATKTVAQNEAPKGGMSKKDAKKACKAEGKKGADLKACIKEKAGK
jgi:hypothetical protein